MHKKPESIQNEFDAQVSHLLQTGHRYKAPAFFTEKVMQQIRQQTIIKPYKPVISKWGWLLVGFFFLVLTVLAMTRPAATSKVMLFSSVMSAGSFISSASHWLSLLSVSVMRQIHSFEWLWPLVVLVAAFLLHAILFAAMPIFKDRRNDTYHLPG